VGSSYYGSGNFNYDILIYNTMEYVGNYRRLDEYIPSITKVEIRGEASALVRISGRVMVT
jgi:hypothetical protein